MNERPFDDFDFDSDGLATLRGLLSDPSLLGSEALWADTDPAVEDAIVAMISAEVGRSDAVADQPQVVPSTPVRPDTTNVHSLDDRRRRRRDRAIAALVGAAAAAIAVVGLGRLDRGNDAAGLELALAGTDLAPSASAAALIDETPDGTRIRLDVSGLPPAAPGTYYEAWLRQSPEVGVSAGTFHLRGGGNDTIELWAGVTTDDYPIVTVTVQDEASPDSSGKVVLRGVVEE